MFKNFTKVLTLVLVIAMMVSMTSCGWFKDCDHVDEDGNNVCDKCDMALDYTYNTYTTTFGSSWNPHTYQTANDSTVLDYTTVGFYTFDYNETKDGFVVVPEMAAAMPLDVTSEYVGEEWGIGEDETSRAWLIELRDDLAWEDGTPITAHDFVASADRLLDPAAINYRADQLYSGDLVLMNAKARFYSGRTATVPSEQAFEGYSEEILDKLVFTLGPAEVESYVRTWVGFPASYDAAKAAEWLIGNYGKYMADKDGNIAFTPEKAAAMEGKTIAEIEADPELVDAWISAAQFGIALAGDPIVWCTSTITNPEVSFDQVGIKAISDTELVIILESPLDGFYLNYSLTGNFGLVKTDIYDKCESIDENGLYSNTYGTSKETYMGFGPYKLETFQLDKQLVFTKNNNWYGHSDPAREGQYQTTKVVIDKYENDDTAFTAFLQGKLDAKGLDVDHIADYTSSSRIYYTDGSSTWFIAMNPNEDAFVEWEAKNPGKDKSILGMKEFRMAISFSLNRQEFINALDPMGSIGLALFNNMICSDPENGTMYRTEEAAKDTILEFWGVSQDDIGAGKLYPTKDEAIASITGYNLEGAKELFNQAYDKAVADGVYNGTDTIEICIGTPNSTAKFYSNGYNFLVDNYTEAVKGTKLEGKLTFTNDDTLGNGFADALRANTVDMLFGVGWTGSALNPYGLIGAYTQPDYQYDPSWDTSKAMMEFEVNGVLYKASVLDWTSAIEGDSVKIMNVETGESIDYVCGTAQVKADPAKQTERILLLAALERAVLNNYDMIPTHNEASASLLGYQVEYGTQEYVYGVGRGGIQYMTYNYTDVEWAEYLEEQGGVLKYN
jgi:oligopeptide transport system substrate-binding protein